VYGSLRQKSSEAISKLDQTGFDTLTINTHRQADMWMEEHGKVLAEEEAALRREGKGRRKDGTEEGGRGVV
jgi:hypothetical protein